MDNSAALCNSLKELFRTTLNTAVPAMDTDLLASGILDSLALVELLLELERSFGITTSVDDLEPDNFRTIASIAHFISVRLDGEDTRRDWTLLRTKVG